MSNGAYSVHLQLRKELENYIKSQYFGKSPILLNAVGKMIDKENVLYKMPYIESSPAYINKKDGFLDASIPEWEKEMFVTLSKEGLGVHRSPYTHQLRALEAFDSGKDVFVSTGTGSGKTECFMWPIISKLAHEARSSLETWSQRGIRVMIMYPMNALVSDQISRLRKLIGDREGKFQHIFSELCGVDGRFPQFGMYTGRTPYPGKEPNKTNDAELEKTLRNIMFPKDQNGEEYYEQLIKKGKIPAKRNIESFLAGLHNSRHIPDEKDAELITRFEMQQFCPDILITNYSMLEYMLLRPQEQKMWMETQKWLESDSNNKLLFVIDEAHMYKGSAGGEVALLIRRLLKKLDISRERVQFILTTASMPNRCEEDNSAVKLFAEQLTSATSKTEFVYLTGDREEIKNELSYDIPIEKFVNANIENIENEVTRLNELNGFWSGIEGFDSTFEKMDSLCFWMYDNLKNYSPFCTLIKQCRGTAVSIYELTEMCFPNTAKEKALKAVSVMLAIAPLARNSEEAVLFPARMHMLFRGIGGVYACTNSECPHCHKDKHLSLGEIFLNDGNMICPECKSVVYELYNDRRCGALYYKGYIIKEDISEKRSTYLWHYSGHTLSTEQLYEIHLYIPEDNFVLPKSKASNPIMPCYLDTKSGFLYFKDDSKANDPNYRKLYYCEYVSVGKPMTMTFSTCPHCKHRLSESQLTSFKTKGNQSFFNLVKAQFQLQPALPDKDPNVMPNEGRKVLLFSDSRQRAAKLARDMSDYSEIEVSRQLFAIAISYMERFGGEYSMDQLYSFFCIAAYENNIHIFDSDDFNRHCSESNSSFERAKRRNRFNPRFTTDNAPIKMSDHIIRLFSGGYNTLYDSATSWIEPIPDVLDECIYELENSGINVDEEEFLELFNAWTMSVLDMATALGHTIKDEIRKEVRKTYDGYYGLKQDWDFSEQIKKIMGWSKNSEEKMIWQRLFTNKFLDSSKDEGNNRLYIDLKQIRPRFDAEHIWFRCEQCSEMTPYTLKGKCPWCGCDQTHSLNSDDKESLNFWTKPISDAVIEHKLLRLIDTEEHTAQLSYKDQRDNMWSKTEKYEMRFQDIIQNNEIPVDILSSTTTMEVGIDIGDLVAVGLRNMPPMRENYQQRAGRAGRRGAGLSTIITFCEDGPHDSLYFNEPVKMFRGEPRRPWIDVKSVKLIMRHFTMLLFQDFLKNMDASMDTIGAAEFIDKYYDDFCSFAENYMTNGECGMGQEIAEFEADDFISYIKNSINELKYKIEKHSELYETVFYNQVKSKSLLDALYEEGIIPTYSFPKNVVSTYISNYDRKLEYRVERGLDIAISEYAPGRGIVVDKKTYQIGGLYYPGSERRKGSSLTPAKSFIDDPNYMKAVRSCDCGWFGTADNDRCPFCGNESLTYSRRMLRPWGFAPRNGLPIQNAQLDEEYTAALPPLYSTLPSSENIVSIRDYQNIKMACRNNQKIIMMNTGLSNQGFVICKDCGAAMPGNRKEALKNIERPYRVSYSVKKCNHDNYENVDLGFDFITDMLVLEISLDKSLINTDLRNCIWLPRAAQSFAEAIRSSACHKLDIEFTELVSGYRTRINQNGAFVDIFLYDSLSSGAGYAVKLGDYIDELLVDTEKLLNNCTCSNACHNCLKHYRNQFVHDKLDRFAALNLLKWCKNSALPNPQSTDKQAELLSGIKNILELYGCNISFTSAGNFLENNGVMKEIKILSDMVVVPYDKKTIYISEECIKYAKPYAVKKIMGLF